MAGGIGITVTQMVNYKREALFTGRNLYTALRVKEYGTPGTETQSRVLVHGVINHGEQNMSDKYRCAVTRYYGLGAGIGRALVAKQDAAAPKVGILGLGAGAVTVYARATDHWRLYEINPMVPDSVGK